MGWRYRRSIRVSRGVRINLSRSGASLSVGGRGVTTNIGPRGTRTTFSLPGTGLSYQTRRRSLAGGSPFGGLVLLALLGAAVIGGSHSGPTTGSQPPSATVADASPPLDHANAAMPGGDDASVLPSRKPGDRDATSEAPVGPAGAHQATAGGHAPWRHVSAQGWRWNLRHPTPDTTRLQVELTDATHADVDVDPAFEALPLDGMNARVDFIRTEIMRSFGAITAGFIFDRDGTLRRAD